MQQDPLVMSMPLAPASAPSVSNVIKKAPWLCLGQDNQNEVQYDILVM